MATAKAEIRRIVFGLHREIAMQTLLGNHRNYSGFYSTASSLPLAWPKASATSLRSGVQGPSAEGLAPIV